jgi:hypothetical protein
MTVKMSIAILIVKTWSFINGSGETNNLQLQSEMEAVPSVFLQSIGNQLQDHTVSKNYKTAKKKKNIYIYISHLQWTWIPLEWVLSWLLFVGIIVSVLS